MMALVVKEKKLSFRKQSDKHNLAMCSSIKISKITKQLQQRDPTVFSFPETSKRWADESKEM